MTDTELKRIESKKSVKFCYIKKGSYYRPDCCGYTDMRYRAGIYEKADAISQAKSCRELYLIPVDPVEHNEMIVKEIQELSTRLIISTP